MLKQSRTTVTIGKITLEVYYFFEEGQKEQWPHTPAIAPSVELRNIIYNEQPIFDLLTEVDCDSFWLKVENKVLEQHGN